MLTKCDDDLLQQKGISNEQIENQLSYFRSGFPYLKISDSATVGNGIPCIDTAAAEHYQTIWDNYLKENRRIVKFVPASGAASRMFKNLFEFLEASYETPTTDFEKRFFNQIGDFAFYADLNETCRKNSGKEIAGLIAAGQFKTIVALLLNSDGLNYGQLPKGLLKFHRYGSDSRTAMEEHLSEGAQYARSQNKEVNIHFTVSPEHRSLFSALVQEKLADYEKQYDARFQVCFSEQKPATDTLAATGDNEPFRDSDGKLVFRPGGHGALIENLNDIDADIIFIKNIDNVVPDRLKEETVRYKKIIGGILVDTQKQINQHIDRLESGDYTMNYLREVITFTHQALFTRNPELKVLEDSELVLYLLRKLCRPIRVCGMVRNEGEPGGGPFLAVNADGTNSPQILESSQIDPQDPEAQAMLKNSTHFNPVDLVCAVKNGTGEKYDLTHFVDPDTGFISLKSKNGKELKALELPGLWNGAMSDWNTLFVEVPVATFNPVKTVNDLLREQHQ